MRILVLDTYYPAALAAWHGRFDGRSYQDHLDGILDCLFGTFSAWSMNLRKFGHDAIDVIANAGDLQAKWRAESGLAGLTGQETVIEQVLRFGADAVILQDVSYLQPEHMRRLKSAGVLIAAQISCPMPAAQNVAELDVCFTSFPHYVDRLRGMGVRRVELMPLAFEPTLVKRVLVPAGQPARHIDVSFVGGLGRASHWQAGTDALEHLAQALGEQFRWYGYGIENIPAWSPLRQCWKGEAWGREMYEIYLKSKIVVNRHGEVAEGCGNNMRQYEITGTGACLVTDQAGVFQAGEDCAVYSSPEQLVATVRGLLADDDARRRIAAAGNGTTLKHHTFAQRMEIVSGVLTTESAQRRGKAGA